MEKIDGSDYNLINQEKANRKIVRKICEVKDLIGGQVVTSKNGVPHLLIHRHGIVYSVAWFKKQSLFKLFFPYFHNNQTRVNLRSAWDIQAYLNNIKFIK